MSKTAIVLPEALTLDFFSNTNKKEAGFIAVLSVRGRPLPGFIKGETEEDIRKEVLAIYEDKDAEEDAEEPFRRLKDNAYVSVLETLQEEDTSVFIQAIGEAEYPASFKLKLELQLARSSGGDGTATVPKVWMHHKADQKRIKVLETEVEARKAEGYELGRSFDRENGKPPEKKFAFYKVKPDGEIERVNLVHKDIQKYIADGYQFGTGRPKKADEPAAEAAPEAGAETPPDTPAVEKAA